MKVMGLIGNEKGITFEVTEQETTCLGMVLTLRECGAKRTIYLSANDVKVIEE